MLKQQQSKMLDIAKEFKKVCEKHNLRYYMAYGTLLGAVRHKGFIPWDDDMDFYMPRSDYEKLIQIDKQDSTNSTNEGFNKQFIFKHWDKTKNYFFSFGKLEDVNTTCIESFFARDNVDYKGGIWIDIFILDGGGDSEDSCKKHFCKLFHCHKMRWKRYHYLKCNPKNPFPLKQIKQFILDIKDPKRNLMRFDFMMDYYKNKSKKLSSIYSFDTSTFISSPGALSVHKKDDFIPYVDLAFEDTTFRAPNNYEGYLREMYGDYMTPPPIEERTGHMPYFVDLNLPFSEYDAPYIKK